ncbi:uncharacterized protein ISCGN_026524 [Ixodes scapularis]
MADLADRYLEAQEQEPARREEAIPDSAASGSRPTSHGQQYKASKLLRKCFLCGRSGHLAAQCKSGQKPSSQAGTCRNCGKFGHTSSQCWNRDGGSQVSCVQASREGLDAVSGRVKGGYVELSDGTKVPVLNAVSGTSRLMGDMPVAAGKLHGQAVTVLRDKGCNTVVVRRSLEPDDKLTGTSSLVYLVDGAARFLPEARTPFYSGNVVAKCMENPLYDLILGNLPNVRAPSEPEAGWNRAEKTEVGLPHDEKQGVEIRATAAMETRSQRQAAKNATPLRVPIIEGVPAKPEELATLQKEDSSLKGLFDRVGKIANCRNSEDTEEFVMHRGLLHRVFRTSEWEVYQDSLSRRLRVSCYLELVAYALLYIPHLFLTLLWNNSEAILTMLFLCVDVEHLDHGTLSKAIFVGDYIGFMAANALISWLALQYALGLAALRVELLSQPRCSLTSMFRRRRRLARHFAFPLLLWCCNTAVGFTVALRQSMHSINITGQLSALLLYSIFQMVHSVWTLVLVAWAAVAFEGSLTNGVRKRMPVGSGQDMAPLLRDYSDALGFFKPEGRCLVRLLAASLGYGVVLYQLTVPYAASTRRQKNSTEHASFGPRYS